MGSPQNDWTEMKKLLILLAAWGVTGSAPLWAQDQKAAPEDPVHNELRIVRDGMTETFNKRDIDGLLQYLHPNVVVTWQNSEVSRGHEGVREYYDRMLLGPNRRVETLSAELEVAELAILYGKDKSTAVAFGTLGDKYRAKNGLDFNLNSRWSATLVKDGNRWLIVNAHASGNVFNNELLHLALRSMAWWTGGIAAVAGIAVGVIVALVINRRRRATAS
jgi:ketosteroid isomerase-like protein